VIGAILLIGILLLLVGFVWLLKRGNTGGAVRLLMYPIAVSGIFLATAALFSLVECRFFLKFGCTSEHDLALILLVTGPSALITVSIALSARHFWNGGSCGVPYG
jgi:hypothetical protein